MKRLTLAAALALALAGTAQAASTELVIYKGANFKGPSDTIKGEVNNLENGFGREVSSIIARGGAWEVCTGDHFSGKCRTLPEGEYATLGNLNERIVSVRFLGANAKVAREDVRDLRRDLNGGNDSDGWYERRRDREAREASREATQEWRSRQDWDRHDNGGWYGRGDWPSQSNSNDYRDRSYYGR